MKRWLKILLLSISIVGALGIFYVVFEMMFLFSDPFGPNDKTYDSKALVENFNDKQKEIYAVKHYMQAIVPRYKEVDIEFEDENIARLTISPIDTGKGSNLTINFRDWDIPINSKRADSLLTVLGWTRNTLNTLRKKLDDANCISIRNGEPSKIGFKRSGLGMYFFNVFDNKIPDSVKASYIKDSCNFIVAGNKLVLEYGGGAIGPQCFPR